MVKYLQLTCNLAGIQTRVPGRTVRETWVAWVLLKQGS